MCLNNTYFIRFVHFAICLLVVISAHAITTKATKLYNRVRTLALATQTAITLTIYALRTKYDIQVYETTI